MPEVHPRLAVLRDRWRNQNWHRCFACMLVGARGCEDDGWTGFLPAPLPPVLLLPAVPPAELRVGDVVDMQADGKALLLLSAPIILPSGKYELIGRWTGGEGGVSNISPDERIRVLREAVP